MNTVFDGLNEEQKKAVQCVEGPVLIVAGAGSGKTRVLTCRVAHILDGGCDPSRVLALTFTKKAAGEMKERIALMVGGERASRVVMGTFHSVFIRFLRKYAESLGYPSNFTISDQGDSESCVKHCIKELQLDEKVYKPKEVQSKISREKNDLYTAKAYRANTEKMLADGRAHKGDFIRIYELYQAKLKQSGLMDFDDILVNMNILLRDNVEARGEIASRFSYIMVDEYQDTNYAQYLILKRLAEPHHNICVVGDDSQSIYAFRGAKIANILNFRKDYPESSIFRLERNYRSTPVIVEAANSVIAHNEGRIPKNCFADGPEGELIKLLKCSSDGEESMTVVSEIMDRMRKDSAQYRDFAILYRTNSQSRSLEEALRRRNIPYVIYSGHAFFDRMEVKDLMAYFKLAVNPNDDESFRRVVNKPARAIGETSLSALNECARANQCSLFKAAFMPDAEAHGLKPATLAKIKAFCEMINGFAIELRVSPAYELAVRIAEKSGLYSYYKSDTSVEGQSRMANIDELLNSVQSFVDEYVDEENPDAGATLADYLENVALLSAVDVSEDEETASNKVSLMTVHSAKGLEFPYVFVVGLEENLFPSLAMVGSLQDLEEERRLFYVAITRAGRAVELSFASSRLRNGKTEFNSPSRFIREIDSKYIQNPILDFDDDDDDRGDSGDFGFSFGSRRFTSSARSFSSGRSFSGGGQRPTLPEKCATLGIIRGGTAGSAGGGVERSETFSGGGQRPTRPEKCATLGIIRGGTAGFAGGGVERSETFSGRGRALTPGSSTLPAEANFVPSDPARLAEGQRVVHERFGGGRILEISGDGDRKCARIQFDGFGIKSILLKYGKLRLE